MSICKIIKLGNPKLREKSTEIPLSQIQSESTKNLIQDLIDTLRSSGGVGIAAPQIGINKKILIIEIDQENKRYKEALATPLQVIINPRVSISDYKLSGLWEGCLSLPGLKGFVKRPRGINLDYFNQNGEKIKIQAFDFMAHVFQHEIDHLNGMLYIDRMEDLTKLSFLEEFEQFWSRSLT